MLKYYKTLSLLIIMIGLFIININPKVKVHGENGRNYTIYIDPGHGGYDDGAVVNGIIEKEINLKVSLYLRSYFEQIGFNVLMIRVEDQDFHEDVLGKKKRSDLQTRIKMINESNADLFLSIHMNSITSSRWFGSQVFYDPDKAENKVLAESVMKSLKDILKNTTREAKEVNNLFILRSIDKPGILVEGGFISNPVEASLIKDPKYQEKLAYAVFIGVLMYLNTN